MSEESALIIIDRKEYEYLIEINNNNGHNKNCYYCGKPCNNFSGNPSEWAIPLCHKDEPGVVKWHHIGCVQKRLND